MDAENLLLKEYESARSAYRDDKLDYQKAVSLFGTILIAIVTFILKGDLPQHAYLLAAGVMVLSALYLAALSYRGSSLAGVLRISEQKLHDWAKSHDPNLHVF